MQVSGEILFVSRIIPLTRKVIVLVSKTFALTSTDILQGSRIIPLTNKVFVLVSKIISLTSKTFMQVSRDILLVSKIVLNRTVLDTLCLCSGQQAGG